MCKYTKSLSYSSRRYVNINNKNHIPMPRGTGKRNNNVNTHTNTATPSRACNYTLYDTLHG